MNRPALSRAEYVEAHPKVPEHMTRATMGIVDQWFVPARKGRFCDYPGGYLKVELIDVRLYPEGPIRDSWLRTHANTPWRVYVEDYDDWNVEAPFATEGKARFVIAKLIIARPLHHNHMSPLGLETA